MAANAALARPVPVFLKIAPDLDDAELVELVAVALEARRGGHRRHQHHAGARRAAQPRTPARRAGCRAQPLFARSTRVLARLARLTGGRLPLIGVGGVASAAQAYAKIRAGATRGAALHRAGLRRAGAGARILEGLDALLAADGFGSVAEAVGTGIEAWDN